MARRFGNSAWTACRWQDAEAGQQAWRPGDAVELGRVQVGQALTQWRIKAEHMRLAGPVPEQLKEFPIKAIKLGTKARFRPLCGHLMPSNTS